MKKLLLIASFIFCLSTVFSQTFIQRTTGTTTPVDNRLKAAWNFYMPTLQDTTLMGGKDSLGCLIYVIPHATVYIRDTMTGGHKWTKLLKFGDVSATFANNGLSKSGDTVQLGGGLTKATTITTNGLTLTIQGSNSSANVFRISNNAAGTALSVSNTSSGPSIFSTSSTGVAVSGIGSSSGGGGLFSSNSGTGADISSNTGLGANISIQSASASTASTVLKLNTNTAGTAANGIAGRIEFGTEVSNTTPNVTSGYIENGWEDANFGTRKSYTSLYNVLNGTVTRYFNLASDGRLTLDGYATLATSTDSVTYKPAAFDVNGNLVKMANWIGGGGTGSSNSNIGSGFRFAVPGTNNIKTLFVTNGLLLDSTSNSNALTAHPDTGFLATKYDLTCKWPQPTIIGNWYNKSFWYNLSDFTLHGTITTQLNGGQVLLSGGTGTYADYVSVGPKTVLERWHMRIRFKLLNAGANYGIAIGTKYQNGAGQGDIVARLTTGAVTGNQMYLARSNSGASLATGDGSYTLALNDIVDLDLLYENYTMRFIYKNVTSGESDTISYTYPNAADFPPMLGLFSVYEFSGEHALQSMLIEYNEVRNPNLMVNGDSKTQGFTTTTFQNRYGKLLEGVYGYTIVNAGGGDQTLQLAERLNDIYLSNPRQIILSIGSNDIRAGRTVAATMATYDSIVHLLTTRGIKVFHIVIPEDSTGGGSGGGVGLTDLKNTIAATYGINYISQVWDSLQTSNVLKPTYNAGDGIHPNTAANLVIKNAIVASGKISNCNNYLYDQVKNTDKIIQLIGDSAFLNPLFIHYIDSIAANGGGSGGGGTVGGTGTANYITKWSNSTTIANSQIQDNGTSIGIAQSPNGSYKLSVTGNSLFTGLISTTGTDAGLMLIDRTPGRNGWGLYSENNILKFYNASIGNTPTQLDSLGRFSSTKILANTTSDNGIGDLQVNGKATIATVDSSATEWTGAFVYIGANGELKKSMVPGSTPGISGSGTAGNIPVFTSSTAIGNGIMSDNGSSINIAGGAQSDFSNAAFKVFAGSTKNVYIGYNGGVSPNYGFIGAATVGSSHDNLILNKDGGNVGIGMVNPVHLISIAGTAYISGETNIGNATDQGAFTLQNTGGLYQNGNVKLNLGSDATGDIYYRDGSGNFVRLAATTNGYVLTLAGGIPTWAASSGGNDTTALYSPLTAYPGAGSDPDTIGIAGLTTLGTAGQSIRINAGGTGFEYYTPLSVSSSEYTATLTNGTNVASSSFVNAHYYRTGDFVNVWMQITIDPTTTGSTDIGISLPFASALSSNDVMGHGNCTSVAAQTVTIGADTSNDRANLVYTATDTGSQSFYISFSYKITPP